MLRYWLILLLFGFGVHWGYAQDDVDDMRDPKVIHELFRKFQTEKAKEEIQERRDRTDKARQNTYIRRTWPDATYQRVLNEKNRITRFNGLDYTFVEDCESYPIDWRVVGEAPALWFLMTSVYPYFKVYDKSLKDYDYFAVELYANLDKVLEEVVFSSESDLMSSIPIEVFERIEAEVFETGAKLNYDVDDLRRRSPKSTAFRGYFNFRLKTYKADLWNKFQHLYTADYPHIADGTYALLDSQRSLVSAIIMANLKKNSDGAIDWDARTFRYYTPPIIMRTIVDGGEGEYRNRASGEYAVRGGEATCLLFPHEERSFPRTMKSTVREKSKERYYQILYNYYTYRDLSDTEFAVELVARLSQVYIAHELAIEGRIIPKVKAHLDSCAWYNGNFGELLAYYAEVKGLNLEQLKATYIKEQSEVLEQVLPDYHQPTVESLLRATLL